MSVREGPIAALMGAAKLSSIVGSKPGDILFGSNGSRPSSARDAVRILRKCEEGLSVGF
jgi:hypothetical protein